MIMQELHKMEIQDLGAKAIVFSQFVNMLDVRSVIMMATGLTFFPSAS
jgi:hypothetical protein